jgi:hypothetical protein
VSCIWEEVNVDSIRISPDNLDLTEGQTARLSVFFYPEEASNPFVDWSYSTDDIVEVDETGLLKTLAPGSVWVTATSLNNSRKDSGYVVVREAVDYMVADFDSIIPVLTAPQPDVAQLYVPGGTSQIDAGNPQVSLSNPSDLVVRYDRPDGTWKLLGIILPTEDFQDLSKYAQFQFKFYGSRVQGFYVQLVPETGDNYEVTTSVEGEDCWKLFTMDLDVAFTLKQFNVFVNPTSETSFPCFFDDFMLAARKAQWYSGLSISDNQLQLAVGEEAVLVAEAEGTPFTWISTEENVVAVDQDGKVSAVATGTARVRAVPLFGDAMECQVQVTESGPTSDEMRESAMAGHGLLRIYPNPVTDRVTVSARFPMHSIEVYTITGSLEYRVEGNGAYHLVIGDLDLDPGIYLVRIRSGENRVFSMKLFRSNQQ